MDFTLNTYRSLIESLKTSGYTFLAFAEYLEGFINQNTLRQTQGYITSEKDSSPDKVGIRMTKENIVILRHDVDNLKLNSLRFARIENELGIKGTYYFRVVPQSYDEQVIKEIAELGHEIGYHYEDVDLVIQRKKMKVKSKKDVEQLVDLAYESFVKNLEMFRKNFDIKTICMHGSPRSKYDNKDIWKKYDYRKLGIIGEPYLDIDFKDVFYLTDTGRRWDGYKVSIRDKVSSQQKLWEEQGLVFHSTQDIINVIEENRLPSKIMITFHPQRWHAAPLPWVKEFVMQNAKNSVKKFIVSLNQDQH